jgi:hypothetical protein
MSAAINFGDERISCRVWDRLQPEVNSGCWIWMGCLQHGYGVVQIKGRRWKVHRLVYESLVSPVPKHLVLDHLCRTTCCANPGHLEPVTSRENTMRGLSPSLASARAASRTHCRAGHALTSDNVYLGNRNGWRRRVCRTCQRHYRVAHARRDAK